MTSNYLSRKLLQRPKSIILVCWLQLLVTPKLSSVHKNARKRLMHSYRLVGSVHLRFPLNFEYFIFDIHFVEGCFGHNTIWAFFHREKHDFVVVYYIFDLLRRWSISLPKEIRLLKQRAKRNILCFALLFSNNSIDDLGRIQPNYILLSRIK